jgi:hypothetical protein
MTFLDTSRAWGEDYTSPLDLDELPRLKSLMFKAPHGFPKLIGSSKRVKILFLEGFTYGQGDLAPFRPTLRHLDLHKIVDGPFVDLPRLKSILLHSCGPPCTQEWSEREITGTIESDSDDDFL